MKPKCVAQFSAVGGEKDSPNSARDPAGFSLKSYTMEGNRGLGL
jgi:catalase